MLVAGKSIKDNVGAFMNLIRTFNEERIVYLWKQSSENERPRQSSPFKTLEDAKVWMSARLFAGYKGTERRTRLIDRRHNFEQRRATEMRQGRSVSLNPLGRRKADHYQFTYIDEVADFVKRLRTGELTLDALQTKG